MALSALTAELKKKRINVIIQTNYKKYYNTYPHVVRLLLKRDRNGLYNNGPLYAQCVAISTMLMNNLEREEYQVRREWYYYNIFCHDPSKVIQTCKDTFKEIEEIVVEQMPPEVLEESSIKPDLPRARTVVVKNLPHKQYRYRVYWPSTAGAMRSIGLHALEAITSHINENPESKPIPQRLVTQIHRMGYQWGGRYFYTSDEDLFCIISLINPKFISKIEKFVTIEELNAKNAS